jgi:hypothetical protein
VIETASRNMPAINKIPLMMKTMTIGFEDQTVMARVISAETPMRVMTQEKRLAPLQ